MLVAALDGLPVEILVRICEFLDHDHISSVLSFALTCKCNYSVAATLLLRTIKFYVLSRPQLAREVQEYRHTLQRSLGFRHVRRLIVDGVPPKKDFKNFNNPRFQRKKRTISSQERGNDDTIFDEQDYVSDEVVTIDHTSVHEIDVSWMPLADFISQLPSLSDLIYKCPSQFPPCLLQTLHQHHPQCRLHINKFYLRSINASTVDAYELKLASSPCLYSIQVLCKKYALSPRYRHNEAPHDFNFEASVQLVTGLAPNLREAHWQIRRSRLGKSFYKIRQEIVSGTEPKTVSRGSLQCLQYSSAGLITKREIAGWTSLIDLSALKALKLDPVVDADALDLLAFECNFSSLTKLSLRMPQTSTVILDSIYQFLRRAPPLSYLELVADISGDLVDGGPRIHLDSFIDRHGATLRELRLPDSLFHPLSPESIKLLRDSCPLLEDLKVTLKRSRGDSDEVNTYMTLGSMQRLKNLFIILDASNPNVLRAANVITSNDSSFNEFEQELFNPRFSHGGRGMLRNGHLRDAFINSALDEKLAREIFNTISAGKPAGSLPLEKLKLEVMGGGHFGSGREFIAIAGVVRNLSRSWLVRRNPRDDSSHELIAKCIYQQPRPEMWWRPLDHAVESIFRRIWPRKEEGGGWWDDWYGLPLTVDA